LKLLVAGGCVRFAQCGRDARDPSNSRRFHPKYLGCMMFVISFL
jgi:hypothetical protein